MTQPLVSSLPAPYPQLHTYGGYVPCEIVITNSHHPYETGCSNSTNFTVRTLQLTGDKMTISCCECQGLKVRDIAQILVDHGKFLSNTTEKKILFHGKVVENDMDLKMLVTGGEVTFHVVECIKRQTQENSKDDSDCDISQLHIS